MKIGYLSDVHTELPNWQPELDVCDVLCLAGDIGNAISGYRQLERFLRKCQSYAKYIIYVPGNHEYWGKRYPEEYTKKMKELCEQIEIIFLDNSLIIIDGIKFFGGCMWTCDYSFTMSDKRNVKNLISFSTSQNKLFLENCENSKPDIVISHHCPWILPSEYQSTEGYSSTCPLINRDSNIRFWIYGHTHERREDIIMGIPLLTNSHGYTKEFEHPGKVRFFEV